MGNNTSVEVPQEGKTSIEIIFYIWVFYLTCHYFNNRVSKKKKKTIEYDECPLKNVIGLESVKEEIKYYMDFIDDKTKYLDWSVKLPKGVLLAGPPGTGKTLLVKTMAEKMDIPIESVSGSEFVEMYVGVGASRVRKLFQKAKKHEKCIIFIDEIDAVGKKRGFDNNSERDSTLNQLLVEMDGFDIMDNIMVFAATNLVSKLDPALTRSGRFDKKIYFDPPNFKERKEMFQLYFLDIKIPSKLSFEILSDRAAGLTGADIANVCNQSKINAIQGKQNTSTVRELDIQTAIDEVMIGREKRERTMTKEERERVAHHEAGHALMGFLLKDCTHPIKVSIVPRGEAALGFSQQKNDNKKLHTKNAILSKIAVLLGGRGAEKIIYDDISTGASDDIEKASSLIYQYSCKWGMNTNLGPINPEVMGIIGKNVSAEFFDECKLILRNIELFVIKTLSKYKKYMVSIAKELLKEETIGYDKIKQLVLDRLENSIVVPI
jgi:ATP-dependent metalloprotease FtsH